MHGWKGAVATFDLCSRLPFSEDVWERCYDNSDFQTSLAIPIVPQYKPNITPIYYSSFHFLCHYTNITPTYFIEWLSLKVCSCVGVRQETSKSSVGQGVDLIPDVSANFWMDCSTVKPKPSTVALSC